MRLLKTLFTAAAALVLLAGSQNAAASSSIRYGIQDDAWLAYGPGTLAERAARLHELGASVVRYTLPWNEIALRRPLEPREPDDPAYDWSRADAVLGALRAEGMTAVVGLSGTPSWANAGRPSNWAPRQKADFAAFHTRRRSATAGCAIGWSGTSRTSGAGCNRRRRASTWTRCSIRPMPRSTRPIGVPWWRAA